MSCTQVRAILGGEDKCYSSTSNVAEENKRKFSLQLLKNGATFCKIKYDKCVYNGTEERCDYLFTVNINHNIQEWVFVELKGQDITKAFNQISAAIRQVGHNNLREKKISAFVVPSKVPKAARTDIGRAKETFAKRHGIIPVVGNNTHTYIVK